MHTRIYRLTLAALVGLAVPAAASEYEASDYLPLAVGNSWTFRHEVYDLYSASEGGERPLGVFHGGAFDVLPPPRYVTITVERTKVIDDTTYYVLSDMPAGDFAPAPPHCPVGKTLRWKGSELMERTDTGERSFFRFKGPNTYTIPLTHGDDEVERGGSATSETYPVPGISFGFSGNNAFDWLDEFEPGWTAVRGVGFLAGYGLSICTEYARGSDYKIFENEFIPHAATLVKKKGGFVGGSSGEDSDDSTVTVSYGDARRGRGGGTSLSSSSWGEIKESR